MKQLQKNVFRLRLVQLMLYTNIVLQNSKPTIDRFSATVYLVGCVLTLICIIIKKDEFQLPLELAINSYQTGIDLLNEISPKFHLARYFLDRLARVISTTDQSIYKYQNRHKISPDLGESEMEISVPPMMSFLADDYWNLGLEKDQSDQQFETLPSQSLWNFTDIGFPTVSR